MNAKQPTDIGARFVCVYCGNPMKESYISCCGELHFTPLELCPECDSDEVDDCIGFSGSGIETSFKLCAKCNHQWGHQ